MISEKYSEWVLKRKRFKVYISPNLDTINDPIL